MEGAIFVRTFVLPLMDFDMGFSFFAGWKALLKMGTSEDWTLEVVLSVSFT
jgi:hypothetical protein